MINMTEEQFLKLLKLWQNFKQSGDSSPVRFHLRNSPNGLVAELNGQVYSLDWRPDVVVSGLTSFEDFESRIIPAKREPTEIGFSGMMLYQSNGMAGEAGEAANEVKKLIRDGDPVGDSFDAVVKECGDQLFYMNRLLKMRGYRIEDAARALLAKLNSMRKLAAHRPDDCPVCQKRICGLM